MIKESGDSSRQELTVKATFASPPATVFVLCVLFSPGKPAPIIWRCRQYVMLFLQSALLNYPHIRCVIKYYNHLAIVILYTVLFGNICISIMLLHV